MELINLTDDQRLYLQIIFDYFHENGKWPTYNYLDRLFLQLHPDLDLDEIIKSLPPGLSRPFNAYLFSASGHSNDEAYLTVQAIYLCQGSEEELADYVRAIRFCVDRYNSPDKDKRQISSSDLISQLGMSELSTRKVGWMLSIELWMFRSFSSNDDSWQGTLSRDARQFRDVETIEQYLEKVEELKKRKKGSSFASEPMQYSIIVTEMGNVEIHPEINTKCWGLYTARKYDEAILNAIKALEGAVRTRAKLPQSCVGVDVINTAFNLKKPLLRYSKRDAEQEGMMSLLRGIIQVFKNPLSHRFAGVQSKAECLGVLLMCSNLLYVVDNAEYVGTV